MLRWLNRRLIKKWIKELEINIEGMRKMADDYREHGGFKEVAETLASEGAVELIPQKLLNDGREAELNFAEACSRLAQCYENLLMAVKEKLSKI